EHADSCHGQHDHGPGRAGRDVDREPGDHHQLAPREVDESHDAEDERDSEGEHRIDAPQADGVDCVLDHVASAMSARPRYAAAKSVLVRSSSRVPLKSMTPLRKTYVRSASSTATPTACSMSRIVIPASRR